MSTETEGQLAVQQSEDMSMEPSGKPRRSYTIEFLLSLSELEVCKKLPSGFDESLLSEFEDTSYGIQDRQRVPGNSSVQGFRRTDYGSSVPARGDSVSYSRGLNRWDSRSSGRSDTDSDSESGRRYSSQARRSGQNSEHDGLLGSGSFPRPTGYAAGASVPRFRPNGNFHLNRSNEPYHPPRPYKAVPHTRREANDSFNDETFGSTDSTTEDRVEEEKKRRAEFELMRKEQQKALQEKQKSGKLEDPFTDIVGLLESPNDRKTSSDLDKVLKQAPHDDSDKIPVHSQAIPSRPLVPPGFVNSAVDKGSTAKSLAHGDLSEVGKSDVENSHQDMISATHLSSSSETHCETISSAAFKPKKLLDSSSAIEAVDMMKGSSLPDVGEVLENGELLVLDSEVAGRKLLGEPGRSTSILEKLFGNNITASNGGTSNFVEGHDAKTDDIWSPNTLQSKFARWFLEEDKKPMEDMSSEKPSDLLSLIVGGEKGGSDVSDVTVMGSILTPEATVGHMIPESVHSTEMSVLLPNSSGQEPKPAVLTCEDLEQSILSEVGGNISNCQPSGEETSALDVKVGAEVDNQASHHLLSLLQKGMGPTNLRSTPNVEQVSVEKGSGHEVGRSNVIDDYTSNGSADGLNSSGKTLTLEALFGTAFMKELHSAQKNAGSARVGVPEPPGLPFSVADGAPFPSSMNDIGSGFGSRDGNISASSDGIAKLNEAGQWLGFHDSGKEVKFSKPPAKVDPTFNSMEGGIEVGLPEEDSFISSLSDPINSQNSMLARNSASYDKTFLSSSSNTPNVIEKLAVLGAALKDERSMVGNQDPSFLHGPYEMVKPELPYQNLHQQPSSPQLHAAQINPGRPLFHALDSHPAHLDPHLKFMSPDVSMHNQLPTNMGHHPPGPPHHSAGLPGFDQLVHPPMLQQMHMAGNLGPPQLLRGFPGGAPMPPHPGHNPAGYIPDHNPIQGLAFSQRQPQYGGPLMGPSGGELGGANNPPEAFQRLLEMELRANPKQMHPFGAGNGGHSRPMYGHELDMGFRYR